MASTGRKSFEQLNLARVVQVVGGHARYQRPHRHLASRQLAIEIAWTEISDRRAQRPVGLFEQGDVMAPRLERDLFWTGEPVGALERKRTASDGWRLSRSKPGTRW